MNLDLTAGSDSVAGSDSEHRTEGPSLPLGRIAFLKCASSVFVSLND